MGNNIPRRRVPNSLCRYTALKEVDDNSSLFKCVTHDDFLPKRITWKEGEKGTFTMEKADCHSLSQVVNVTISSDQSH